MVAAAASQLGGCNILVNSGLLARRLRERSGSDRNRRRRRLVLDFNTKYLGAVRCARPVIPQ